MKAYTEKEALRIFKKTDEWVEAVKKEWEKLFQEIK